MKGVIFSTSFFILIFVVFFNLSNYIHFEHNRAQINNNFKKTMFEIAHEISDQESFKRDDVLNLFKERIENVLPKDYEFDVKLLGYYHDPILIRIQLDCKSTVNSYQFTLEETIIEKELEEDEVKEQ